jgi:hypothetical protein
MKLSKYIIGCIGYLFCKIVYVENTDGNYRGFVMQKRVLPMLLISPLGISIYFLKYGIGGVKKWFYFISTYKCHYIQSQKRKLTLKEKLMYINYFIKNY